MDLCFDLQGCGLQSCMSSKVNSTKLTQHMSPEAICILLGLHGR